VPLTRSLSSYIVHRLFRLYRMLPTIAISLRRSVSLSVTRLTLRRVQCVRGHSVQPLPNHFGLLLTSHAAVLVTVSRSVSKALSPLDRRRVRTRLMSTDSLQQSKRQRETVRERAPCARGDLLHPVRYLQGRLTRCLYVDRC